MVSGEKLGFISFNPTYRATFIRMPTTSAGGVCEVMGNV